MNAMKKEREIEILMLDRCTRAEAEKHMNRGTVVIEDLEENFDSYMQEWGIGEDEMEEYKAMIEKGEPMEDWGIVKDGGKTYYIMYCI